MAEIASAYISLIPSFRGVQSALQQQLTAAGKNASQSGNQTGKQYSSGFGGGLKGFASVGAQAFKTVGKVGLAAVGTVGAAIGGLALKGGFSRALAIDTARAKMKGLGWDTAKIKTVMNNASNAVEGTAFALDEAATVASMFGASGIKGGTEMENALKAVTNVAAVSGRSMTDIGNIFASVKARGKLMGDDLLQLTSAGVPAITLLAQKLGTTEAAVSDMVSKGQIDFQTFSDAMREGLGESAVAMGDTAAGSFANVMTAFKKMGAVLAQPIIDNITPVFKELKPVINKVTEALTPLAEAIGQKLAVSFDNITDRLKKFSDSLSGFKLPDFSKLKTVFAGLLPLLGQLGGSFGGVLTKIPIIGRAFLGLTGPVGAVIGGFIALYTQSEPFRKGISDLIGLVGQIATDAMPLFAAASYAAGTAIKMLGDVIGPVLSFLSSCPGLIETVGAGLLAYVGVVKTITFLTKAWAAVTKLQAVAQAALNVIMSLNPIGLIIAAIVAVIAAFYLLWTKCEWFRNFWKAVWDGIKDVVSAVADWFTNTLVPWFQSVWENIKNIVSTVWNTIVQVITTVVNTIKTVITAVITTISAIWSAIWNGIRLVVSTVWNGIVAVVTGTINTIRAVISRVISGIRNIWSAGWNAVTGIISSVWGRMKSIVSGGVNAVLNTIRRIPSNIRSAFSSAGSWLLNAGKQIIRGLINGIKSMISNVKSTLKSLTNLLPSWKGPESKDKNLLVGAGQLIIQGFVRGLESQYGQVRSSLNELTDSIATPVLSPKVGTISGSRAQNWGTADATYSAPFANGKSQAGTVNQYFPNVHDPYASALAAARGLLGVPVDVGTRQMAGGLA